MEKRLLSAKTPAVACQKHSRACIKGSLEEQAAWLKRWDDLSLKRVEAAVGKFKKLMEACNGAPKYGQAVRKALYHMADVAHSAQMFETILSGAEPYPETHASIARLWEMRAMVCVEAAKSREALFKAYGLCPPYGDANYKAIQLIRESFRE